MERIPGADLLSEDSPVAHYGVFSIVNHMANNPELVDFMATSTACRPSRSCSSKNYRTPGIAETSIRTSRSGTSM